MLLLSVIFATSIVACFGCGQESNVVDHTNFLNTTQVQDHLWDFLDVNNEWYELSSPDSSERYDTFQNNRIYHTTLHGHNSQRNTKPVIMVISGIHGRNWLSTSATMYFIEKLLGKHVSKDKNALKMLNEFDWIVVPLLNPDGYEYSQAHQDSKDRDWRKNRRDDGSCVDGVGVDLNRNFDAFFDFVKRNCSNELYGGPEAFSEPETKKVKELFDSVKHRLVGFVSVFDFGRILVHSPALMTLDAIHKVYPEIYNNLNESVRVGADMRNAIRRETGESYRYGTVYQLFNVTFSGMSIDWASAKKDGIYAFDIGLRGSNRVSDPDRYTTGDIIPSGEDLYAALEAMVVNMDPKWVKKLMFKTTSFQISNRFAAARNNQ